MRDFPQRPAPRQTWLKPVIIVCAVAYAIMLPIVGSYMFMRSIGQPRGNLVRVTDWPKPFSDMFGADEIRVLGLAQFLDDRVIVEVKGLDDLIQQVIETYELIPTDRTHAFASTLKEKMPRQWGKWLDADSDRWFTTKDFGTVHLEGQDLFLLVTNPQTGRTIIYYNWIF